MAGRPGCGVNAVIVFTCALAGALVAHRGSPAPTTEPGGGSAAVAVERRADRCDDLGDLRRLRRAAGDRSSRPGRPGRASGAIGWNAGSRSAPSGMSVSRLRADVVGVVGREPSRTTRVEDLVGARQVREPGDAALAGARAEGDEDLRLAAEQVRQLLVLRGSDAAVEQGEVMEPSAIASTSVYLASMTAGQKTISKRSRRRRGAVSLRLSTAISQPPHDAAQYIAKRGLPSALMPSPRGVASSPRAALMFAGTGSSSATPSHGGTPASAATRRAVVPVASRPGQLSGPSARISSTILVISLASCTPSAALAQTSLMRPGSRPSSASVRLSRLKRRSAL